MLAAYIKFKDYNFGEFICLLFSHVCLFYTENLKLIAEYFESNETFGGPLRDWMGIYEECAT